MVTPPSIPRATVARLALYLHYLSELGDVRPSVSSEDIGAATNVNAAKVRKDLSYLGPGGTRGVGYAVAPLRRRITRALGLTKDLSVAIVGAGNLGSALARYPGFSQRGFTVAALFDIDPAKIGRRIGGHRVSHLDDLDAIAASIFVAIIATPAEVAQSVADRLAAAGVGAILNFAPTLLKTARNVVVRNVDLSTELQILTYHAAQGSKSGVAENLGSAEDKQPQVGS